MRIPAAMAMSLSLLAPGCGQVAREGTASGSGNTPAAPVQAPSAITGPPIGGASIEEIKAPLVRMAELEIDPAQLENYKAAVKEEMETSVRVEPGVLAIYAVAEKENPTKLRFFEMYADEAAYKAHLDSAHFKTYVTTTKPMIISTWC